MGDTGDRQMRLRLQGEETDEDNDQLASLDPEGQDMEWALRSREVHGVVDEQRSKGAPRTDLPEQQGEKLDTGKKKVPPTPLFVGAIDPDDVWDAEIYSSSFD